MIKHLLAAILCLTIAAPQVSAKADRSAKVLREFKLQNPCPSTGEAKGSCPGYIIDHIEPLCAGGADAVENLQWQTVEDAKVKDKQEWERCRVIRRGMQ